MEYIDHRVVTAGARTSDDRTKEFNNRLQDMYKKGYVLVSPITHIQETSNNYTCFYGTVAKPAKAKERL